MKSLHTSLLPILCATALHWGTAANAQTITPPPATTPPTATPSPTRTRSVDLAGDLAKANLAKQGITNPTPSQLADARKSIAAQRAQGMGWGQIAHSMGLNLGKVISAANRERRDARKAQAKAAQEKDKDHRSKTGHHTQGNRHGADHKSGNKSTEHGEGDHGAGGGHGGGGKGK